MARAHRSLETRFPTSAKITRECVHPPCTMNTHILFVSWTVHTPTTCIYVHFPTFWYHKLTTRIRDALESCDFKLQFSSILLLYNFDVANPSMLIFSYGSYLCVHLFQPCVIVAMNSTYACLFVALEPFQHACYSISDVCTFLVLLNQPCLWYCVHDLSLSSSPELSFFLHKAYCLI